MVPEVAAERPTATSERRVTRRTDASCTGSYDAYAENWPTASNGSLDMVAYIYVFPQPFEACWSPKTSHTPKNTSKPSKSIEIISLGFSTSFVSVSDRLALE